MAGDYVPFDHDFPEKPEVLSLVRNASATVAQRERNASVTVGEVMLRMHKMWRMFDRQTTDGVLRGLGLDSLAMSCGGDESFWSAVADVGWLTVTPEGLMMPGFRERFKVSARERMKRYRENKKDARAQQPRNASATGAQQNAQHSDAPEPEPEPEPEPVSSIQEPLPEDSCVAALRLSAQPTLATVSDAWNAIAAIEGLPGIERCKAATAKRQSAFKQRIREPYWRDHWAEALERLAASTFAQGGGKDGWRASLDWFLRPDTVTRIQEGRYDERQASGQSDPRGNIAAVNAYCRDIDEGRA